MTKADRDMPTHEDLQRSLGRVEGSQDAMGDRMDRLERMMSEGFKSINDGLEGIKTRLQTIEKTESERRGAWRVVVAVSTAVSAIVATVAGWLIKLFV